MESVARCSSNDHLVIIGNGMASHRLIETLVCHTQRPQHITVIGEESVPAYNRILLSPLLAGELNPQELTLRGQTWYAEQGITLRLGEAVIAIHPGARRITTTQGELHYDCLVIATGSQPTLPNVPGITLEGVHTFRDLRDAEALAAIAQRGGDAVVIGGGLLGLEAAEGLRKRAGKALNVSVLQRSERLMNRQLDDTAANLLQHTLTERGLNIITHASPTALEDNGHGYVQAVQLSDGRRLPADSVIIAAGITPNVDLARQAGLACDRAIVVDNHLATSHAHIFALGECCQYEQYTYGLVEPIWRQVEVLAARLCNDTTAGYQEVATATKLKVSGISLYAFGPTHPSPHHEVLRYHDPGQGEYRRLLLRDGRIEGAVLYGDTHYGPWYFEQSLAGANIVTCRQALLFGPADTQALQEAQAHSEPSTLSTQEAA
ncbi:NAD(P)/FAD-dependent oxidoreductase [Vreelandella olivaria]|uniref:NAD(P)/FAD-dependent oxidoreductase n=1 Tax=Vreelandella olivaria TaxID=390919 RepID=UPI00201F03DF|nr:FAD-dependent oxidoreductase [Halomonas olivaria]